MIDNSLDEGGFQGLYGATAISVITRWTAFSREKLLGL